MKVDQHCFVERALELPQPATNIFLIIYAYNRYREWRRKLWFDFVNLLFRDHDLGSERRKRRICRLLPSAAQTRCFVIYCLRIVSVLLEFESNALFRGPRHVYQTHHIRQLKSCWIALMAHFYDLCWKAEPFIVCLLMLVLGYKHFTTFSVHWSSSTWMR